MDPQHPPGSSHGQQQQQQQQQQQRQLPDYDINHGGHYGSSPFIHRCMDGFANQRFLGASAAVCPPYPNRAENPADYLVLAIGPRLCARPRVLHRCMGKRMRGRISLLMWHDADKSRRSTRVFMAPIEISLRHTGSKQSTTWKVIHMTTSSTNCRLHESRRS